MPMKPELISIREYDIEVYDNHQVSDDTILIFHWNSGSALSSTKIFNTKLSRNNRIIVASLLGHGNSSKSTDPQSEYSIAGVGRCIADIVKAYNLSKYWLVGQSISAHAIMESYEIFPNCAGFVSVSAPPISMNTLSEAFVESPVSALLFKGDLSDQELGEVSKNFIEYDNNMDIVSSDFQRTDPLFRLSLGASIAAGLVRDEISCVKKFQFPSLFIRAENDSFLSADYYRSLADVHSLKLNVTEIRGSGHAVFLDNIDECSSIIENFIHEKH